MTRSARLLLAAVLVLAGGCGQKTGVGPTACCPRPDPRIPSLVPQDNRCEFIEGQPQAYQWAVPWLNALAMDTSPSTVEVDYLALHACVGKALEASKDCLWRGLLCRMAGRTRKGSLVIDGA